MSKIFLAAVLTLSLFSCKKASTTSLPLLSSSYKPLTAHLQLTVQMQQAQLRGHQGLHLQRK